mmetsp:Transcript_14581/g.24881  ORF Transcript_14581/g.24881 Transcript_14581/m.24881 type:complete len:91 (-) Transcript_14581:1266-1538(-)
METLTEQHIESTVLKTLGEKGSIANTEQFSAETAIPKEQLDPILKSLEGLEYIKLAVIEKSLIELTEEGKSYALNGSPEFQLVSAMKLGE